MAERLIDECKIILVLREKRREQAGQSPKPDAESPSVSTGQEIANSPAEAQLAPANTFTQQVRTWTISFQGREIQIKHSKGLAYISHLIKRQGQEVHVADLVAQVAGCDKPLVIGAAGEALDDEAIQSYKKRLDELDFEIQEAKANADLGRVASAEAEISTLKDQITASLGFRGRHREVAGDVEKIRKAVSLAISRAMVSFQAAHPELFHHLLESLKLGTVMSYAPEKPVQWAMGA